MIGIKPRAQFSAFAQRGFDAVRQQPQHFIAACKAVRCIVMRKIVNIKVEDEPACIGIVVDAAARGQSEAGFVVQSGAFVHDQQFIDAFRGLSGELRLLFGVR